jgi:hypothetical protein
MNKLKTKIFIKLLREVEKEKLPCEKCGDSEPLLLPYLSIFMGHPEFICLQCHPMQKVG